MSYPIQIKDKAKHLRTKGYSIREIAKLLAIAQGTASVWSENVKLDTAAKLRLQKRRVFGQYKSGEIQKQKSLSNKKRFEDDAKVLLQQLPHNKALYKLLASFLLWTEGSKSARSYISFINSDPLMIQTFLTLLRKSFSLNESKFRALMHLHEYHKEQQQMIFWSKVANISKRRFSKTYLKPHTGKRIREGYQGSLRIRYYDARIAMELRAIYNTFAKQCIGT